MTYTNSSLVSHTRLSPNNSGARTHTIDRITPHCVVGQCSVETIGNIFARASYKASSNYGIGYDGRVGMYVEEKNPGVPRAIPMTSVPLRSNAPLTPLNRTRSKMLSIRS